MAQPHVLDQLLAVIRERRRARPEGSYVVQLLDGAPERPAKKVVEEAGELAIAAAMGASDQVASEAADLLFHALVLLEAVDVPAERVWEELAGRFGIGGLEEKASR